MPDSNRLDADGWRHMFEMGADNPESWRAQAQTLLRASRLIAADVGVAGELTDVIVGVQAMLAGMAIECALKALWLKQDRKFARPGAGFLRDGQLVLGAMGGATGHDLRKMGIAVGRANPEELDLLERLSWFVVWAGRFPVPRKSDGMVPRDMATREHVIPHVITVGDLETADALAVQVIEEATPWK